MGLRHQSKPLAGRLWCSITNVLKSDLSFGVVATTDAGSVEGESPTRVILASESLPPPTRGRWRASRTLALDLSVGVVSTTDGGSVEGESSAARLI
jgi:hypothetical protein